MAIGILNSFGAVFILGIGKGKCQGKYCLTCLDDCELFLFDTEGAARNFARDYRPKLAINS